MHKYEHKNQPVFIPGTPKKAAIIGARGYSGLDLARILLQHPGAELVACFAGEQTFILSDFLPEEEARSIPVLNMAELETKALELDTIFLATPAETSLELTKRIRAIKGANAHIVDLSGAFRLDAKGTRDWYNMEQDPLAETAVFGLSPFSRKHENAGSPQLVANPGCFATSILMALVPLLNEKVVSADRITIDSKSGATGAGKKAQERLLFTEVADECLPYRIGKHQHLPEIIRWTKAFTGHSIDPFFATHLLPVRRGIISALYLELLPGKDLSHVQAAFEKAYTFYPLVKFGQSEGLLKLKKVCGSGRTHIQFQAAGNKLYVFSLIDNLMKGAASQAVENFNLLHGYPVELGLRNLEGNL
jgi:N-acetyl-gamma-glutamyl-phosphate reductase